MISEEEKKAAKLKKVNRAFKNYLEKIDRSKKVEIKKKDITYPELFDDKMMIIHVIREGLPYKLFSKIKELTPFTEDDWADYLNISKKSLQRYKSEEDYIFKSIHTEKIIELAEVTNFGKSVFDSTEQFYNWLNTPSYALGNLNPAELLKDSYGKELVMAELNRIEYGIFT